MNTAVGVCASAAPLVKALGCPPNRANPNRGLSGSLVLGKAVAERLDLPPGAQVAARLRALDGLAIAAPSATSAYLTPVKDAAEALGAKIRFVYMSRRWSPHSRQAQSRGSSPRRPSR